MTPSMGGDNSSQQARELGCAWLPRLCLDGAVITGRKRALPKSQAKSAASVNHCGSFDISCGYADWGSVSVLFEADNFKLRCKKTSP